ncbi:hypothetical protein [Streptomyces sp. DSM 41534]
MTEPTTPATAPLCGDQLTEWTCILPAGLHPDWKHRGDGHWWDQTRPLPETPAPLSPEREADIRERAAAEKPGHHAIRAVLAELDRTRAERDRATRAFDALAEKHDQAKAERDELEKKVAALDGRLNDAAMTRVWTNEDGKKFVFVEDIAPALLGLNQGPIR